MLDEVSSKLGNTRTVCKKYYVFPPLIESFEQGTLYPYLKKVKNIPPAAAETALTIDEKVLLSYLKNERKKKEASRS